MAEVVNVYMHKNEGRLMAYVKDENGHKVVSYPRVIMEEHLGRKLLPNEQVHHKDENPLNNDIDNLEVLTCEEHAKLHSEENRKYYDKEMICPICGSEFLWSAEQQMRFHSNLSRKKHKYKYETAAVPFCSKSCAGKYGKKVQKEHGATKRKLTNEQVEYIRKNYTPNDKEFGQRALARKFNIDSSAIRSILSGKTYKDVV